MKSKIGLLMKIQVMRLCNPAFFTNNSDNKKKRRIQMTLVGGVVLAGVMMWYSGMIAYGYARIGEAAVVPRMMTGTCSLMLIFLTFMKSSGSLFGSKDFDMMLSLPVKNYHVVTVKFMALYFIGLLAYIVFLLPSLVVYAVYTGPGVGQILSMILMVILGPVLPTVLAMALGTLIVAVTSRLPHRQLFSLVLSAGVILAFVVWMSGISMKGEAELANIGVSISELVARVYPPAAWAASYVEGRGIGGILVFTAVSGGVFGLFVWVVSRYYIPINSAIASLKRRQAKRARSGKASSVFQALFRKELRRLMTCNIYALNTAIGAVFLLAVGVGVLVMDPASIEKTIGIPGILEHIQVIAPLILAFFVALSPTTAASLSLEGRNRWIMCSLPVEPIQIFHAKIALNLVLTIPAAVICGICFFIKFHPTGLQAVLLFVIPASYALFSSVFGMFANVKFPSYDWNHEQQAVKNSASVMISVLGGMLLPMIPLMISLRFPGYAQAISSAGAAAVLIIAGVCYRKLKNTILYV
ncbi:MAG: hypothetical protein Q4D16_06745 [Eubacteriales bacterium]|nr:hypothetical protein [Eubacteriales bacterium]